jgi:hypothetical protein
MNELNTNVKGNEMDFYMYESVCKSWLGTYTNIKHIITSKDISEEDVINKVKESLNNNGTMTCNINLLQKYHMIIYPKKSYSSLTRLNFHK